MENRNHRARFFAEIVAGDRLTLYNTTVWFWLNSGMMPCLGGRHGKDRDERERDGETSGCKCLYGISIDKASGVSDIEDRETNRHSGRTVHGMDCKARRQ